MKKILLRTSPTKEGNIIKESKKSFENKGKHVTKCFKNENDVFNNSLTTKSEMSES